MKRPATDLLRDALTYAAHALDNEGGLDAGALAGAPQPLHAALFDLIVLGEALSSVPQDLRALAPEVPWSAIINTRHRLVHTYWQVDLTIVAGVIERDLVPLMRALETLLTVLEHDLPS